MTETRRQMIRRFYDQAGTKIDWLVADYGRALEIVVDQVNELNERDQEPSEDHVRLGDMLSDMLSYAASLKETHDQIKTLL